MGLGGTYRLGEDFKSSYEGQTTKGWLGPVYCLGPLKTTSKDFHLAIGDGLGWIKWLKNGAEKGFIFQAVFYALYPFW